ncbi:eotaxin-like [Epinephelus moara]|uniref:eotaxin-like n=1 Tax=Epinephelus moara TaxID=300413 RepID=UPI00214F59B3|nr:eotaxin-like [Epinephelus moara]
MEDRSQRMTFSLVLAAFLCFTTWMTTVCATNVGVSSCCLHLSNTQVRLKRIVNYTIQTVSPCPIKAIVFETKNGTKICSDPKNKWAIRAMQKVDKEREKTALQEKGQTEEGSTSDITPAVASASKSAPQQNRRNGRGRQRKRSRKGRKKSRKGRKGQRNPM